MAARCDAKPHIDGEMRAGELVGLPLYDRKAEIPRGKLVSIPHRPE
jgi:hypothetical protein